MNQFEDVKLSDIIKDSLPKLLNRDGTAVTLSAGSSFPQDLDNSMIGRLCNRVDLHCIYTLSSLSPVTWTLVLDYSSAPAKMSEVAAAYQPKNQKLTALSNVGVGTNKVPYFINNQGEMSVFDISALGKSLVGKETAQEVLTLLELGDLATKDTIGGEDILDSSITKEKLAFTPLTKEQSFETGDIKETFSDDIPNGWIKLEGSIGSAQSDATYANDNSQNLFLTLWGNSSSTVEPRKGSSAVSDWQENKKIVFPSTETFNAGTTYLIKL